MEKAEIIEGMLDLVDSPDKWCKHVLSRTDENGVEQFCLLGAMMRVRTGEYYRWTEDMAPVITLFNEIAGELGYEDEYWDSPAVQFNNAPETEYEDLRLFLKEALVRATQD